MTSVGVGLISLVVLLMCKVVIVAGRIAFNGVRRTQLKEAVDSGDKAAASVLAILEDGQKASASLQLAAITMSFAAASVMTILILPSVVNDNGIILGLSILFAFVWYFFSEVIGEFIAQRDNLAIAARLSTVVRFIMILSSPVVLITNAIRFVGKKDLDSHYTEEEIMELVEAGEEEGIIDLQEREMISRVFQLDETVAREIMVPRIDVVALEINTPLEKARSIIIEEGHSRIPVYTDSLDQINGLLYAKDLLEVWENNETPESLELLLRSPIFVPETQPVSDLLQNLQNQAVHLAIVVDEYGGTAGLVTIEDIMEEIVGEILDEYDEDEEAAYEKVSDVEYIFDARIDLDDFERMLDVKVPIEHGEETLGGFIYGRLGKIPDAGEVIPTDRLIMTVLEVVDKRIKKVHVTIEEKEQATQPSEEENDDDNE